MRNGLSFWAKRKKRDKKERIEKWMDRTVSVYIRKHRWDIGVFPCKEEVVYLEILIKVNNFYHIVNLFKPAINITRSCVIILKRNKRRWSCRNKGYAVELVQTDWKHMKFRLIKQDNVSHQSKTKMVS